MQEGRAPVPQHPVPSAGPLAPTPARSPFMGGGRGQGPGLLGGGAGRAPCPSTAPRGHLRQGLGRGATRKPCCLLPPGGVAAP